MTQNTYFSLLAHIKKLVLVRFCNATAGIEAHFQTDRQTDGMTEVKFEIVT